MNPNERLLSKLRQKQKELGLTESDTGLQEEPALAQPGLSRQEDLEFYEQMFAEMVQRQYPLAESDRRELAYFQQVFRLSDQDVQEIQQRVTGEAMQADGYEDLSLEPMAVSFKDPPPPPGATVPPQDSYSGEGSTHPTVRNRPASGNRAAMQNRVKQIGEDMGFAGHPAEPTGQSPGFAPPPADPMVAAEPPRSPVAPPPVDSVSMPHPTIAAPSGEVTSVQAAPVPNSPPSVQSSTSVAPPEVVEARPAPVARRPLLERRVLIPLLFLTLFLLTAGLVAWAMLRLYALPASVDPQRSREFIAAGTQKTQQGKIQEAIQEFDRAIQFNPNDANAYINRGYARHLAGNLGGAVDDYRKAIELNPKSAQAFSNLSHVRFDQGRFSDAEKAATDAINLKKDLPEALVNLGNAQFAQGKLDLAAQQFQAALDLPASSATKARARNNLGNTFLARDNVQQAGQEYDQAIQLDPQYADAFFNRAIAHERNQSFQVAAQDFAEAAKWYKTQGNNRRASDAQNRADRAKQSSGTTPAPPVSPNADQRAI